jgi:hypothetical protein
MQFFLHLPDLLDTDFLLSRQGLDLPNVGMIARLDTRAFDTALAKIAISLLAMERHCHSQRCGSFAHALWPSEKIGVMQAIVG